MLNPEKHPKGLPFLFFTEMWERFGYYLMLGIFFLYMTDINTGGLALERKDASDIFGTYIALVFITPFIGGLLADRVLGYRLAITIGGALMGVGYMLLAIPGQTTFYLALALMIIGNGFFKPNISTLVGNLYNEPKYKPNKDSGYNIFYMGINIGAFICNFFAAYLRNHFGWGYAFFAAGIGMFIGLIIFWSGTKHYKHADVIKPTNPEDMSLGKILGIVLLPALIAGYLGWIIPGNIFGSDSTDAFIFGALPITFFYISLLVKANADDRKPLAALLAIMGVVIIFWAIFKQNGTALTTWAESYTDRELPASIVGPAKVLGVVQEIPYTQDSVVLSDEQFRPIKDASGKIQKVIDYPSYYKNIDPATIPKQGESLKVLSTELFQSVNPFFVILLTPVVVGFFAWARRKKFEPSTPGKIFWGLVITALSTTIMMAAVMVGHNGIDKVSMAWLIGSYGVITVGELCLSPMGLSLVSKLSPPRLTALMMGGWFLSTSIGNKLSGVLASLWDTYDHKSSFFMVNCFIVLLAALSIFLMLKWLAKIIREHGG
ncbi:MAG: peptide MFS transporter [Bacteroidia bacterium]|jgi:POT family proton-dependent oligopeptide transporter